MNVVIVAGALSRPAVRRQLPSGDALVELQVSVRPPQGPAESVPVVWFEAPASASSLDVGDAVVVLGRVRRRFFRPTAGGTASRTEVVAEMVVPARQAKRVAAALARARDAIVAG